MLDIGFNSTTEASGLLPTPVLPTSVPQFAIKPSSFPVWPRVRDPSLTVRSGGVALDLQGLFEAMNCRRQRPHVRIAMGQSQGPWS